MLGRTVFALLFLVVATQAGCRGSSAPGAPAANAAASALTSVTQPEGTLPFWLQFDLDPAHANARCGAPFTLHGVEDVQLTDLRFFVSEVVLLAADGTEHPATIQPIAPFQNAAVALIDMEDGSGRCVSGDADVHTTLQLWAPADIDFHGVAFSLGVPFAQNHADPMTAPAPLDRTAMHWTWQAGYKFIRAGFFSSVGPWQLHVGSAGCEGTVGDVIACSTPNRARIVLNGALGTASTIFVNPTALLPAAAMNPEAPRAVRDGCMADLGDEGCTESLAAMGVSPSPQQLFRLLVN